MGGAARRKAGSIPLLPPFQNHMNSLQFHPLADIFPLLPETELASLAQDIKTNGLQQPIWLYDSKIIDGRNRYLACLKVGVPPMNRDYKGNDPLGFVVSMNLHRRHLNESQRAIVAGKLANLTHGGRRACRQDANLHLEISMEKAAKMLNISKRNVASAKTIMREAPEQVQAIEQGKETIAGSMRQIKKRQYADKVSKVSDKPKVAPAGPFDLILADPPWRYESGTCDPSDSIENHYGTATLEDIFKHSPNAAKDSILFLWATAPKLEEAIQVMNAWGFTYRSCAVWDKEIIGLGYWWRIQHELLLVGVKGNPKCTPEPARISSIFREKRRKHSQKPECVSEWIERAFSDAKKLEMYCRQPRPGWAVWGNEV